MKPAEVYASMMDMDASLVRHYLVGATNEPDEVIVTELLELKNLIANLDPKVARDVIVSKSGDRVGTLECLRHLGEVHSTKVEKKEHKAEGNEKRKEKGFFDWLFGKKSKHETAKVSRDTPKAKNHEKTVHHPETANKPEVKQSNGVEHSENGGEGSIPSDATHRQLTPDNSSELTKRYFGRPAPIKCPEEERLSNEYNFASSASTVHGSTIDPGDEFQAIYSQFVNMAKKS
ncbi:uncharacterized protein TM35_000074320 [Trypanosoma theileri]|uniref:Uncharacterized protein n=1 Tax=Trypanosoma theileri TaxID=67003 RepID=A0A1X0P2F2_9TRYP|nr:uncharacterized protein TM35_000074320 [Trypanosoma theileri]ORC91008.1 hypothetical protein TM35_000074320 [Trypanosoma theileri]